MVHEAARCAARALGDLGTRRRRPYVGGTPPRAGEPVLLVPGFLAGDGTLRPMAAVLRSQGHRTYRSHIRANVGCTLDAATDLEARLVYLAKRRGSRVRIVATASEACWPGSRFPPSGPGRGHRDIGEPDAGAGCQTCRTEPQRRGAGAPVPRRSARSHGRGLRGRGVCTAELRPSQAAVGRGHRLHNDLQPPRRGRGLARLHRPGRGVRGGAFLPHRHGAGSQGHRRRRRGAPARRDVGWRRPAGTLSGRSRSRRNCAASPAGAPR